MVEVWVSEFGNCFQETLRRSTIGGADMNLLHTESASVGIGKKPSLNASRFRFLSVAALGGTESTRVSVRTNTV
jgi:hypothetical protein